MRYCRYCKVMVRSEGQKCPLCHNLLPPGESEEIYPRIPTVYRQFHLFFRILLFCSVVLAVVSITVNLLIPESGHWWAYVVAALACVWLLLTAAIRKRQNLLKSLLYQTTLLLLLSVFWDAATHWRGWSLTYALPAICVCAMVAMTVLNKVLRLHVAQQLIYLLLLIFYGNLPALFVALDLVSVSWPSLICVGCSVIFLAGVLIFKGKAMAEELRRRFHLS
ncbi:DUF6320 domain-containing protein [Acidaminobacterium chupaoyuni]